MASTTTITCNNCQRRVELITFVPQYRCLCGYVTCTSPSTPAAAAAAAGDEGNKHSRRRRAAIALLQTKIRSNNSSTSIHRVINICSSTSTSRSSSNTSDTSGTRSIRVGPNKRALLCGVTYKQHKYKLQGTANDVNNMKALLIDTYNFPPDCIRVLSEDHDAHGHQLSLPTKKNIEDSLEWLVKGCQSGDSLVFYFSGHGLRQPDFKDDEQDGFDETICPLDFMKEGMILDNYLNSTIVAPLKQGVTLHAIVDACHSGTILDLEWVYDKNKKAWKDNSPPSRVKKGTSGGLAISLSACDDDKMAADTAAFSHRKVMNGAMTYILIETIKKQPEISYGDLLDSMLDHIAKVNQDRWLNSRIMRKVFRHKIIQEPLLSSSEKFDVYSKKFIL